MTTDMLTIDGSQGEGGGQILRSSLALALVTGRPFTIEKIRAKRKKPGLLQQHLTAVRAAADVCGAEVEGIALGSRRFVFRPGPVRSGNYSFRVGTAGTQRSSCRPSFRLCFWPKASRTSCWRAVRTTRWPRRWIFWRRRTCRW